MAINALSTRVQSALNAAGHHGVCTIEYLDPHTPTATITFLKTDNTPVVVTVDMIGKHLAELTEQVTAALIAGGA